MIQNSVYSTLILFLVLAAPAAAQKDAASGSPGKNQATRVVPSTGAIYHYKWQHPATGFRNPDGSESLTQHFSQAEKVNYADSAWHKSQVESMMEAELDFFAPSFSFDAIQSRSSASVRSVTGLEALIVAMKSIVKAGGQPPRIAMFLDTTELLRTSSTRVVDLKGAPGTSVLEGPVFKFFDTVPSGMWFEMNDFPVIFVDASHGASHDKDLFNRLSDAFLVRYKKRPWIVADTSWRTATTARWQKGASLHGPLGGAEVQVVGPGYDDSRTQDRGTPLRKREDSRFYQWSWNKVLLGNPTVVLIESWNDFNNGNGIADCLEYGNLYLNLTRRFIGRLKNRILPDMNKPVRLAHPQPIPRPDKGWWKIQGVADRVFFVASEHRSDFGYGLRLGRAEDGVFRRTKTAGTSTITPASQARSESYLYFGIADEFAYRIGGSYEIEVIFHPASRGRVTLQYDSWDRAAPVAGSYKSTPSIELQSSDKNRLICKIPDPRFGNRQNGGTDFRLALRGDNFAIIGIQARRLPDKIMKTRATVELR